VSSFVASQGYDTTDPLCNLPETNTPAGCVVCYNTIAVSDDDCIAAYAQCF